MQELAPCLLLEELKLNIFHDQYSKVLQSVFLLHAKLRAIETSLRRCFYHLVKKCKMLDARFQLFFNQSTV